MLCFIKGFGTFMNQTIWVNAMETSIKLHVLRFQWPGDHWTGWRWSVYFHHSGLMNTQLLFESPGVCGTSSWVLAPERWGEIQISSLCWTRKNLTIPFPPTLEILQWFLYLPVSTIIQKKSNFTKLAVKKKKIHWTILPKYSFLLNTAYHGRFVFNFLFL